MVERYVKKSVLLNWSLIGQCNCYQWEFHESWEIEPVRHFKQYYLLTHNSELPGSFVKSFLLWLFTLFLFYHWHASPWIENWHCHFGKLKKRVQTSLFSPIWEFECLSKGHFNVFFLMLLTMFPLPVDLRLQYWFILLFMLDLYKMWFFPHCIIFV